MSHFMPTVQAKLLLGKMASIIKMRLMDAVDFQSQKWFASQKRQMFHCQCVCVCALSRCARYFPFSHSHSVPCGVRALISYCYISSRVQMLTHMSVCVCYMLRHVNILSKIKASCLLKLFADTLPISHWFFLVSSSQTSHTLHFGQKHLVGKFKIRS